MTQSFTMDSCFGTLKLRTGSFICAYINLVVHLLMVTLYFRVLLNYARYHLIMLTVDISFILLNVIFIIILLVGLHATRRGAMNAYIVYSYVFFAFSFLMFIAYAFGAEDEFVIGFKVISLCFTGFFWFVIRSYFLSLDNANTTLNDDKIPL